MSSCKHPTSKLNTRPGGLCRREFPKNTLPPVADLGRLGIVNSAQVLTGCAEIASRICARPCLELLADRLHLEHTFGVLAVRGVNLDCKG